MLPSIWRAATFRLFALTHFIYPSSTATLTTSAKAIVHPLDDLHLSTPQSTTPTSAQTTSVVDAADQAGDVENLFDDLGKEHLRAPSPRIAPALMIPPAEDPMLRYVASALVRRGNRALGSRIITRTLMHIHALTRSAPLPILRTALLHAAPAVKCAVLRRGNKNVHKPVALSEKQRMKFAVRWVLESSKTRLGRTVEERLAREMIFVVQGQSKALKKKEETHTFAMVNRGNAKTRT